MNKNEIAKVTISYEADNALNRMLGEVNKDFTGGRITKHQLLSWFVTSQDGAPFQRAIEKVQREYFDHIAHMENLIKRIKKARRFLLRAKGCATLDVRDRKRRGFGF